MTQRLYLRESQLAGAAEGAELTLESDQAHYLTRVLRLKSGDGLYCFDGVGREWRASLKRDGRHALVTLGALSRQEPPPTHKLVLAAAWLKGAAMDTVVQKATELDATEVVVLRTTRGNVQVDERRVDSKLRHWRQIAASAAEQSGRLYLPQIHDPVALNDALDGFGNCRRVMLDPGGPALDVGNRPVDLMLLVGPEGGWTDAERAQALAQGAEIVGLGRTVLRAETVPLAALAAVHQCWGWGR